MAAQEPVAGNEGTITINAVEETPVTTWQITETSANDNYVANDTGGWNKRKGGAKDSTGSFHMKAKPSFRAGAELAFVGYTGTDIYTQNIIVDTIGVVTDMNTGLIVAYDVAFSGNGPLVPTTGSLA